jgi:NADH-quinone oxidoreductase subunit H
MRTVGLGWALTGLVLALVAALAGCQSEGAPPLISVDKLSPRELETGEHLRIEGVGFPEGKVAHVTFHGALYRPGRESVTGATVELTAVATSASLVDVPITDAVSALFTGARGEALHTTFAGDVTVAFAAKSPAAPPIAGTRSSVWVDVRPAPAASVQADALAEDGACAASFVGLKLSPEPGLSGLVVREVGSGLPGEAAHLALGDILTEWNGVRVHSVSDLATPAGQRGVWVRLERAGEANEMLAQLSLVGMGAPPLSSVTSSAVILGLGAVLYLLFLTPTPPFFAFLLFYAAEARERDAAARGRSAPALWKLAACALSTSLLVFPLSRWMGLADLDVAVLSCVWVTALTLTALFSAPREPGGHVVTTAARGALRAALLATPWALTVGGVVIRVGSLGLTDIVERQGGNPWQFLAFQSPPLLGVWLLSMATELAVRKRGGSDAIRVSVVCAVSAALLFGGFALPGVSADEVLATPWLTAMGAVLFALKTWLLVVFVAVIRRRLPPLAPEDIVRVSLTRFVPLSGVLVGLSVLLPAWGLGSSAAVLVGPVMLAATAAALVHVVVRVASIQRDRVPPLED